MVIKELLSMMCIDGSYKIKINENQNGYVYDNDFITKNMDLFLQARVDYICIRKNKIVMITIYKCDIKGALK